VDKRQNLFLDGHQKTGVRRRDRLRDDVPPEALVQWQVGRKFAEKARYLPENPDHIRLLVEDEVEAAARRRRGFRAGEFLAKSWENLASDSIRTGPNYLLSTEVILQRRDNFGKSTWREPEGLA
jgi:hypothetical protein